MVAFGSFLTSVASVMKRVFLIIALHISKRNRGSLVFRNESFKAKNTSAKLRLRSVCPLISEGPGERYLSCTRFARSLCNTLCQCEPLELSFVSSSLS